MEELLVARKEDDKLCLLFGIRGLQVHQQPQALLVLDPRAADALATTSASLLKAGLASAPAATRALFLLEL